MFSLFAAVNPTEVIGIPQVTIGGAIVSALSAVGVTVLAGKAGLRAHMKLFRW